MVDHSFSGVQFVQLCFELASGGLRLGFHPLLIDAYFSLHFCASTDSMWPSSSQWSFLVPAGVSWRHLVHLLREAFTVC
jgi:hypothetical protein